MEPRDLMTMSWVTQVAAEPKLLGVGVERGALTHELLKGRSVFALSILPPDRACSGARFAKPVVDQAVDEETGVGVMEGAAVRARFTGSPILEVAVAWIECELRHHPGARQPQLVRGGGRGLWRSRPGLPTGDGTGPGPAPGGHPDELRGLSAGRVVLST